MMIVKLEDGCWIADGVGDPPRTVVEENAKQFSTMADAHRALREARKYRPFKNAVIEDDFC